MRQTLRSLALFASAVVLLSFGVLVVNQTAQVVQLAGSIDPTLGTVTLWGLLGTYAVLVGVPVVLVLRLPRPLVPPPTDTGPEFEAHLERLRARLRANPLLAGRDLAGRAGVEEALQVLGARADAIVRETAATVFLTTAVSQGGRLDGLIVLGVQSRMLWRLAHLYHQRPGLRDMATLYANVAGTAFIAGTVEEIDLGEQIEPVLSSALGALGASVPGFQVAGAVLTNCVLSGSTNAFLTLRVGMIARRHCGALVVEPRAALRRSATTEAARLLGGIVSEGSARLSKAVLRASVGKLGGAVSGVSGAGARLVSRVWSGGRPMEASP